LGAYEILYGGTPGPVSINESVELAKRFGAAHSGQFVNGILDKLLQRDGGPTQSDASRNAQVDDVTSVKA
jgi:N utilization substance protein B